MPSSCVTFGQLFSLARSQLYYNNSVYLIDMLKGSSEMVHKEFSAMSDTG